MPLTQSQIEEVHRFRQDVVEADGVYEPRISAEESVFFVSLRRIACNVLLRRLSPAEGKTKVAKIAGVLAGEDTLLDELINRVKDSIAFVEAEQCELVS